MKIRVDREVCQGHALCFAQAPALYPLDELGYSALEECTVPSGMEDAARAGAAACPEGAITLEETNAYVLETSVKPTGMGRES